MRYFWLIFAFLCHYANATCSITSGTVDNPNYVLTASQMALGVDVPIPSVFLSQNSQMPGASTKTITCTEATSASNWVISREYDPSAILTPSGYTGTYGGPIYKSKVPGIGFYLSGASMPIGSYGTNSTQQSSCYGKGSCSFAATTWTLGINIVKIGEVAGGTSLVLDDIIPCVLFKGGVAESPSTMTTFARACVTGTVVVSNFTCVTPTSVNVPMGRYPINKTFSGINSATTWMDAGITLSGCTSAYGSASGGVSTDSGITTSATMASNIIKVYLTPGSDIINAASGTFKLASNSTASGVAFQLALDRPGSPLPLNLSISPQMSAVLPNSNGQTIKVPLLVRLIQTAGTVTPGTVYGVVTYTINYN